jgi:hypothetical protein
VSLHDVLHAEHTQHTQDPAEHKAGARQTQQSPDHVACFPLLSIRE